MKLEVYCNKHGNRETTSPFCPKCGQEVEVSIYPKQVIKVAKSYELDLAHNDYVQLLPRGLVKVRVGSRQGSSYTCWSQVKHSSRVVNSEGYDEGYPYFAGVIESIVMEPFEQLQCEWRCDCEGDSVETRGFTIIYLGSNIYAIL